MTEEARLEKHARTSPGIRMPPFDLMEQIPIFGAITGRSRGFLLGSAKRIELQKGDTFFRQGEPGDGVFILETGSVEIIKRHEEGLFRLRTLKRGDCFGEMALLAMTPRTATVRACEPVSAIWLKSTSFQALYHHDLEQFTLFMMNLAREVCRRLQRTDELLFRLSPGAMVQALAETTEADTTERKSTKEPSKEP